MYKNFDKNIFEIHFTKSKTCKDLFDEMIDRFEIRKYYFDEGFFVIDGNLINLSDIIKECEQKKLQLKVF